LLLAKAWNSRGRWTHQIHRERFIQFNHLWRWKNSRFGCYYTNHVYGRDEWA